MASEPSSRDAATAAASTAPATRVVYDFAANRVLAHHFVGDSWVARARSGHFDKYLPFDGGVWRLEKAGDIDVAAPGSSSASILVPERARSLGADHLRVFVSTAAGGVLKVRSGGARIATIKLEAGWAEVDVPLEGAIGPRLTFEMSRRARLKIAALALGRGEVDGLGDKRASPLSLAAGESLSYYVSRVTGAILEGRASGSCEIRAALDGRGVPQPLPLTLEDGAVAMRIDFSIHGCEQGSIESLALRAPVVNVESGSGEPPKNIILWVMDTLRADRIRPINPGARAEVPGFEKLARRGVTFRRAWVEGNESKASHASMWTSVYPAVHNIRSAGKPGEWQIGSRFITIGDLVRAGGKRAVGLTANGMVTGKAGYSRGFERFENPMRDGTGKRRNGWIPVERLYKRAIELLEPLSADPFFFFLGTIDNHKPWVGHQPWLDRYDPGYRGKFARAAYPGQLGMKHGSMQCTVVPKPRDLQRINAIYDSAISYQDAHLLKLLEWLEERGILEDTLIIVTADHGEELWEVGRCGHGASLREVLVNVPLLISYPKRLPSGLVVEEGVDGVDILPTVLELLDIERPRSLQGGSLVSVAREGGAGYPRASYASQYEYAHAMRIGDWKMRIGKGIEVYNLAEDEAEMKNRAGTAALAEQQLYDALSLFLRHRWSWRKSTWGVANNLTAEGALALEK